MGCRRIGQGQQAPGQRTANKDKGPMKDEPEQMKKANLNKLLKTKDYSGYQKTNPSNLLKTKDRVFGRIFY
jgi:hypothetical protein